MMIRGAVDSNREARVGVEVFGLNHQRRTIEAVVDTGFDGYLTLPKEEIDALGLPFAGKRLAMLGDGSQCAFDCYYAMIRWHQGLSDMTIIQSEAEPLLGMSLLESSRMTIDVTEEGGVRIEELS